MSCAGVAAASAWPVYAVVADKVTLWSYASLRSKTQ
jgi:hypothetical protein